VNTQDVADLHRIMLELHSLVADQGEVSDSISDHVENASEHIEEGNKHLKKATIAKVYFKIMYYLTFPRTTTLPW